MLNRLTRAFKEHDRERILRYSADLGHYIGDAHVPLHCTRNYNGQLSGQHGIHGFWESRKGDFILSKETIAEMDSLNRIVGGANADAHDHKD
jgi:hypothetical protein